MWYFITFIFVKKIGGKNMKRAKYYNSNLFITFTFALKNKNKSCDMLCQYENFCIRDQGIVNMNNFGSTPLFNIFTVDQPGPRAPPPTSYSTTNFKDRYPAYDYSTPLRIDTHPKIAAASESDVSDTFYAASDILNVSITAACQCTTTLQ